MNHSNGIIDSRCSPVTFVYVRRKFELKEDRRNINMSVYSIYVYTVVPCLFKLSCVKCCVSVRLNISSLLCLWDAETDSKSCLLMAFLCSVSRACFSFVLRKVCSKFFRWFVCHVNVKRSE